MTDKEELELFAVPKDRWGEGPWQHEPDEVEWITEHGYSGFMARNHQGAWCGYVGVLPTHPLHGRGPLDVDLEAHGGINIAGALRGKPADVWWFGFDCGHVWDDSPAMIALAREISGRDLAGGTYWTVNMVRAEVETLAKQIHAAATATSPQGSEGA